MDVLCGICMLLILYVYYFKQTLTFPRRFVFIGETPSHAVDVDASSLILNKFKIKIIHYKNIILINLIRCKYLVATAVVYTRTLIRIDYR